MEKEAKKYMSTAAEVFWFYPNLIGYLRIIGMILSFYFAMKNWKLSVVCYTIAFIGDVFDGYAARAFNQSMRF